jgi:hypothetical protein
VDVLIRPANLTYERDDDDDDDDDDGGGGGAVVVNDINGSDGISCTEEHEIEKLEW